MQFAIVGVPPLGGFQGIPAKTGTPTRPSLPNALTRFLQRVLHADAIDVDVLRAGQVDPLLPHDRLENVQARVPARLHHDPPGSLVVGELGPRAAVAQDFLGWLASGADQLPSAPRCQPSIASAPLIVTFPPP